MPDFKPYAEYTREELIIKFLPLVENLGRKFATSQQASGVLTINDIIQIGSEALVKVVDRIDWDRLADCNDVERSLKSFLSKRIKGEMRRRIDMAKGSIRIPEGKLTEMRKNPNDKAMVALFFNSVLLSIDQMVDDDQGGVYQVVDQSEPYNIAILNAYLIGLLTKYLNKKEFEVLRLSYGLDCNKHSASEIADILKIEGVSRFVRVSELKRKAVQKLIDNVDPDEVMDYL